LNFDTQQWINSMIDKQIRLILCVEPRSAGKRRFLSAIKGESHTAVVAVEPDPTRESRQERSIRMAAADHALEILNSQGLKLDVSDEELIRRFIDSQIDRAELKGKNI
jgi:hypothetical protein